MTNTDPSLGIAMERLQSRVEVGFAKIDGQNALILLRLDQWDSKHADLTLRVNELEDWKGEMDKSAVTNEQLKDRTRFILTIMTTVVVVITGVFGAIQFFTP
ncbi:hypothetical protein ACTMTF_15165 [Nonomuraea sp. ZG12]|uniref:hypothetical protein n=1 Tax=Nonomuraea sp. ZG12 TaxID=3452207 RepID=UPI003F8C638B